jgi:4-hydroxybenzoate polyprenyltransferase
METVNSLYRKINLLSLDIVAGVVICALFFSRIFQVHIRPQGLITLGLSVWIIYTADHLLDARKIKGDASTERHRFHQRNFLSLSLLLGMGTVLNAILIFFIREPVFFWGLLWIGIVAVYLIFQKHLRFFKEVIAALLYTGGVLLPSLAVSHDAVNLFSAALIVQFFLIAWFNLILFSWFDEEKDIRDKQHSFVTTVGRDRTRRFLFIIFFLSGIIFCSQLMYHTRWLIPLCILMTMNSILLLILLCEQWFRTHDRFRLWGDAVFLLPVLFLLLTAYHERI